MVVVVFGTWKPFNPEHLKKQRYKLSEYCQIYKREKGYKLVTPHEIKDVRSPVVFEEIRKAADEYIRKIIIPQEGPGLYRAHAMLGDHGITSIISKKHYGTGGRTQGKEVVNVFLED